MSVDDITFIYSDIDIGLITNKFKILSDNTYQYIGIADCGISFNTNTKVDLTDAKMSLKLENIYIPYIGSYSNEYKCKYIKPEQMSSTPLFVSSLQDKATPHNSWRNILESYNNSTILLSCNPNGDKYQIILEVTNITLTSMNDNSISFIPFNNTTIEKTFEKIDILE